MDYRNDLRRDPFARGANGRYSPTFAPAGRGLAKRPENVVSPAVQDAINTLPLAMAYVPEQKFEGIKDPACALAAGTIFDALDLPFSGCRPRGGGR